MFCNLQIGGVAELHVNAVSPAASVFAKTGCIHLPSRVVRDTMGDLPADDYIENTVRLEESFYKYFGKSLVFRCHDVSG